MRIENNTVNFNGFIKITPTMKNLYQTASPETKNEILKIATAMERKDDSLVFKFANSISKRKDKDFFHIGLIEDNIKNSGYSVARKVIEINQNYATSKEACINNKNLLSKFTNFFKDKYAEELNEIQDCISYDVIRRFNFH